MIADNLTLPRSLTILALTSLRFSPWLHALAFRCFAHCRRISAAGWLSPVFLTLRDCTAALLISSAFTRLRFRPSLDDAASAADGPLNGLRPLAHRCFSTISTYFLGEIPPRNKMAKSTDTSRRCAIVS
jgi:hypothetical protein